MSKQIISLKIDKDTNRLLEQYAIKYNKSKSAVIRKAIQDYIDSSTLSPGASMLEMAQKAKKFKYQAPKDAVIKMDKYLYGNEEI